ncbi:adenylate kinase [Hydrocarboniphaga sp.]|uniref:adenylate kinase n=1 Tax=Hydrocarboniphaga sp. TaxID=2033016 RepID=UPI003D0F3A88
MKKVAIFGNAGGGKSTLAKQLAANTGLPLHALDRLCFRPGGDAVAADVYAELHRELLDRSEWLIEGFGSLESTWARLAAADTLVYVDLPLALHAWWVTKRLIKSRFVPPEGWPEKSPMWKGTLNGYRVLRLCHKHLTPKYREYVAAQAAIKTVFHLKSRADIARFLRTLQSDSAIGAPCRGGCLGTGRDLP